MKLFSLAACALHLAAVVLASGVNFCVRAQGTASWEWNGCACCGGEDDGDGCGSGHDARPEGCTIAERCGGCRDGISLVSSGLRAPEALPAAALQGVGTAGAVAAGAVEATAPDAAPAGAAAPAFLPLRC